MTNGSIPEGYDLGQIISGLGAERARRFLPPALLERSKGMVEALQSSIKMRADGFAQRFDGWFNEVTGHGTGRDKTTYGYVLPDRLLTDAELSALYHFDDMAGRMVDVIPQEMFREGFLVETGEPGLNAQVREKHRELATRQNLMDGQRWGRAFGGGATLIGCDDGLPMEEPLVPERAKDLTFLLTMDRRLIWPLTYYTEPGPKMGKVRQYMITTVNPGGGLAFSTAIIHESRLIVHRGMSTAEQERRQLMSWDLSIYQRAYGSLRQFNTGWSSTEQLMADGSQAVYTIGGLQAIIASGGEELLQERIRAMDMFRSVVRGIVLDADANETFERKGASLEGWYQVLQQQMLRLAAAVEMPVTILMGQSPAGMNATGESDFRWFYDRIRSMQTNIAAPMVERLTAIWLRTKAGQQALAKAVERLGRDIVSVIASFPDLWRETPKDRAAREYQIAQTDQIYLMNQVYSPDRVALVRGRAGGFDQAIVLSDREIKEAEMRIQQSLTLAETDDATVPGGEGEGEEDDDMKLALTHDDLLAIVTVDEARASLDPPLPPLPGEGGDLTVAQFKAQAGQKPAEEKAPPPPPGEPAEETEEEEPEEDPDADDPDAEGARNEQEGERTDAVKRPRTFTLQRDEDDTGVSGTGEVAHGCLFPDGKVAMRWTTATASTTMFDTLADVEKVHGHGGKTRIRWHDERADAWHALTEVAKA